MKLVKCVACGVVRRDVEMVCDNCGCRLSEAGHPVFGFDTPDSIRKEVSEVADEMVTSFDSKKVKSVVLMAAEKITAAIAAFPEEDLEKIVVGQAALTKAYGEAVIAIMPLIAAVAETVKGISEAFAVMNAPVEAPQEDAE